MKLLISGFEPPWGLRRCASGELARLWASESLSPHEVRSVVLPRLFRESTRRLCTEILAFGPEAVLMYGDAGPGPVRLERFALNVEDARAGDNSRIPVLDRQVSMGGPPAYEATVPLREMAAALASAGLPGRLSYGAGTGVGNSLFYGVQHFLASRDGARPAVGLFGLPAPSDFGTGNDGDGSAPPWSDLRSVSSVLAGLVG